MGFNIRSHPDSKTDAVMALQKLPFFEFVKHFDLFNSGPFAFEVELCVINFVQRETLGFYF